MRRIGPTTSLAIAMAFVICGIVAGSAPAYAEHGRRHGDRDRHDRGERRDRGRHERDTATYYPSEPDVYYAPPVVVYPPPRAPSGITLFFPFWFR
jgi:hypothetical protein